MKWVKGDLLEVAIKENADSIGFTANSFVTSRRALVMGAGAALAIKEAFPGCDYELGNEILRGKVSWYPGVQPDYIAAMVQRDFQNSKIYLYAIQVKRDFKDKGDFNLTQMSLMKVKQHSELYGRKFVINCPLIGLGGYKDRKDEVFSMVESTLGNSNVIVTTL